VARGTLWNHENIWLVFAFTGLVLFPWLLTGEWARASARSKAYLFRGVFVILGAFAVLAAAQQA
jgi:hypothetical protein